MPGVLTLIVLGLLICQCVFRSLGETDFTDPVQVAVIALPDITGAGTGKWADKHDKTLRDTDFHFGVFDARTKRLSLTTGRDGLTKPQTGVLYV